MKGKILMFAIVLFAALLSPRFSHGQCSGGVCARGAGPISRVVHRERTRERVIFKRVRCR